MPTIDPDEFKAKVERILACMFGGLHNLPNQIEWNMGEAFQMAKIRIPGYLATFDFDLLTRLVILSHDEMVRAELSPCSKVNMMLRFHPRENRSGRLHERHPSLEFATKRIRDDYEYWRRACQPK